MDKPALINKIKSLDGLAQDEKAALIDLLNQTKKYGLVWEDKPEAVEEQLRTQLPVLIEVSERRILAEQLINQAAAVTSGKAAPTPSPDLFSATSQEPIALALRETEENSQQPIASPPNHILIEGDNLHALTALTFTHEGRIDVIYIDPPYNTGNKDFKYNDRFVDKEDSYRHSKWLSFMHKRLQIAKKLLSEKGVIFISIDDNEQAQLKILCDEIIGEGNFIGNVIRATGTTTGQDTGGMGKAFDYLLVYSKTPGYQIGGIALEEHDLKRYNLVDDKGNFSILQLRRTGNEDRREDRPTMFFAIKSPDGTDIYPYGPTGYESRWRVGPEKVKKMLKEDLIYFKKDGNDWRVYYKYYSENRTKRPSNLWDDLDGNKKAQIEVKEIFNDKVFDTPKPIQLINRIIQLTTISNEESFILDFFAGSGTTLHATMQLNAEDGGKRQCIMVTNNENKIAEEVCYERNKRVIQGYTNSKGNWVDGLSNNNLRYYKTDFVGSARTEQNRRKLTRLSTALLQIKEDCYTDTTAQYGFDIENCHISTNEQGRHLIVLYHSRKQAEVIEQLRAFIRSLPATDEKIKLYAFGEEKEILLDAFYDVAARMEAVPLPDAIYNAYRATFRSLKLERKAPVNIAAEAESDSETTDNETKPTED